MKAKLNPSKDIPAFEFDRWLSKVSHGKSPVAYAGNKQIFSQGDPADAIFYLQKGRVKLTVVSKQGKEAVLAMLDEGSFLGEGCLAGQPQRMATATAVQTCSLFRFKKEVMASLLRDEPRFSEAFTHYLLTRTIRVEEDLVDQLFNSSEKRLARILLLLAKYGKPGAHLPIIPKVSQETLAAMVGTTRPRINHFMNKFRKMGFVDYNDTLEVHDSLLTVVLHD